MGIFNDIKKVLFGAKSVTKSAAQQVGAQGKKSGREALDQVDEIFDSAMEKVKDTSEDIREGVKDTWDRVVGEDRASTDSSSDPLSAQNDVATDGGGTEVIEQLGSTVIDAAQSTTEKLGSVAEEIGGAVLDKAGQAISAAGGLAENIGKKVLDKSEDVLENLNEKIQPGTSTDPHASAGEKLIDEMKDLTENVGERVLEAKKDMFDRAKEFTSDLGDKIDDTLKKAQDLEAGENQTAAFKPHTEQLDKSLLEGKDDFFAKAEAYAEGRYDEVTDPFSSKPRITRNPEAEATPDDRVTAGFEDLDGDGDEIMDDAIIIQEEE